MSKATHATRLAIALVAASLVAACSPASVDTEAGHNPAAATSSSAGLPDGRIEVGAQRAQAKGKATGQSCIDCHGADGNAPIDATYPKLGGQYADYLAHALQAYRSGDREHPLMGPQGKDLTDQEIADLAAWFASRPSQLVDLHDMH